MYPYNIMHINQHMYYKQSNTNYILLERVQRRFLRSAGFLLGIEHPPHDSSAVADNLGLVSLDERRRML